MTACAFPYVIAFTNDTMEIRLIINGNLVHTITMPNLSLITSKRDVFFATTAPEFFPGKCERIRLDSKPSEEMPCSPPPLAQTSSSSRSSFQSNVFSDFFALCTNVKTIPFPDRYVIHLSLIVLRYRRIFKQESSFRRQSGRLETDKNLSDTSANALEKHNVQL